MKTRRMEVTIETDEIWIIRRPSSGLVAWCSACGRQTTMITPDEAALLAELDAREVYRQAVTGLIHYNETSGGHMVVCSNSIAKLIGESRCS